MTNVTGIAEPTLTVGSEAYSVNSANNQMTARGNVSYTYDAAGNLTSDGTRTFTWDALGRLKQVQQGNQTVATYGYDIQNRRFRKSVGSTTTYYLYNLDNQLIAELSGNGTVLREYVWLDGQPLVLAEYTGANAGVYFYLNDHLGTPQQLLNGDTGAVAWQAAYLPFGEVQISVNTVTNNLRFPEQYYDAETGLHYNWNRYYDPASGRYISAELIGLNGGLNLYNYIDNNPINLYDIFGLAKVGDVVFFNFKGSNWPEHIAVVSSTDSQGNAISAFGAWQDTMKFHDIDLRKYQSKNIQSSIIGYGDMSNLHSDTLETFIKKWNQRMVGDGQRWVRTGNVCIDAITREEDGWGGKVLKDAMRNDYFKRRNSYNEIFPNLTPKNEFFYRRNGILQRFFKNTGRYENKWQSR